MEEKKKSNKIMFIILGIVIVALIGIVVFLVLKLNNNNTNNQIENNSQQLKQSSDNPQVNEDLKTSFANLKADDKKFNEIQSTIIDYFDYNYFTSIYFSELQSYPQIFKDAKIATDNVVVLKVLKSTDEEFEVVAYEQGAYYGYDKLKVEELDEGRLMIIKGKQLESRLIKGSIIPVLYGRYTGVENFDIDGKSYVLPVINAINVLKETNDKNTSYRFDLSDIKTVAKYIFGENIKISAPEENYYTVTLDNQSNLNFSAFDMYRNYGAILYNNVEEGIIKRIFVSADFQHFFVSTYNEKLKILYLDYFDKNLNKVWGREFESNTIDKDLTIPIDYNNTQFAMVLDNDLYLIDITNGENIIEPVLVGQKVNINMMEDGIVLIGNDNKDTFMKVAYDGKTIFKTNGNVKFTKSINNARMQIVDGKMVVYLEGVGIESNDPAEQYGSYYKYVVLNSDGTIEKATDTIALYN